jgi:hypothetical protein
MGAIPSLAGPNLALAQATVATLGVVVMIGVGFLGRPHRSTLLWSIAFLVAMVSAWSVVLAEATDSEVMRRAGIGLLLGATGFLWAGFRALRTSATRWWLPALVAVVSPAVLAGAGPGEAYSVAFRVLFLVSAGFSFLIVSEWLRLPDRTDAVLYPLVVISVLTAALGIFVALGGFFFPASSGDDLALVRSVNQLGFVAYLVCAQVSLVGYATRTERADPDRAPSAWEAFLAIARERLGRAEARGERSWALLLFRVDDEEDLREALGPAGHAAVCARFEEALRRSFPADADVAVRCPGTAAVLISRPEPVLRSAIRSALARVARMDDTAGLEIQVSASVGWVSADAAGYDLDAMIERATDAAVAARIAGGDRWERVTA